MVIQHNLLAAYGANVLSGTKKKQNENMEKLSSGYRVNRAADDAAGLSISEKMRNQIRGLNQAVNNIDDGISYVQTAEGALQEIHNMLGRMQTLAVKAANDVNAEEDRQAIDDEIQELKAEMNKVFSDTQFNGTKIWSANCDETLVGYNRVQAAAFTGNSKSFDITETNKGAIAKGTYNLVVDGTDPDDPGSYGFHVGWEGYDGNNYRSGLISWDNLSDYNGMDVNLSDYMDYTAYPAAAGIDVHIQWSGQPEAELSQIATAVNNTRYYSVANTSESYSMTTVGDGVSIGFSTNYVAELALNRNMDSYDTAWIEPKLNGEGSNLITKPSYTSTTEDTGWKFAFTLSDGTDAVAEATGISYSVNSLQQADYGKWWETRTDSNDRPYNTIKSYTPGIGNRPTLHGLTDVVTDEAGRGLSLTADAVSEGTAIISFNIKRSDGSPLTYGSTSVGNIGDMSMYISIRNSDTADTLMNRMKAALNKNTVFDIYSGNSSSGAPGADGSYAYGARMNSSVVELPIYEGGHELYLQTGANAGEDMKIVYKALTASNLGLDRVETTTREGAEYAMTAIQEATKIISAERSKFGAYQNRLEHTRAANVNYAENLTSAESSIRDTDVADEMTALSKNRILEQAAISMLSNSNSNNQSVLSLLGS